FPAARNADASEEAWTQAVVCIRKHPASTQGARRGIDTVVDEVDVALVRKPCVIRQSHLSWDLLVSRTDASAFAAELQIFQNGALIGVAVEIQRIERNYRREQSRSGTSDSAAD